MFKKYWQVLKQSAAAYADDGALSRGAAIAFYTITSLGPVLVIVIAIAGLAFGHQAASGAISRQLGGIMGHQGADTLEAAIKSASGKSSGIWASIIGLVTLLITASGVFGEMQNALNVIWKAEPKGGTVTRMMKARAASLGLVMTLGFLLMVSLVISAGVTALSDVVDAYIPFGHLLLHLVNIVISFVMISVLFAAIYKILPDKKLEWRDVIVGAVATSVLFTIGKTLIGFYLGSSTVASSYGAAGGLIVALLWVYYSAQIFLFGSEFTKAYAVTWGSHKGSHISDPQHVSEQQPKAAAPPPPKRPLGWAAVAGSIMVIADVLKARGSVPILRKRGPSQSPRASGNPL